MNLIFIVYLELVEDLLLGFNGGYYYICCCFVGLYFSLKTAMPSGVSTSLATLYMCLYKVKVRRKRKRERESFPLIYPNKFGPLDHH